MSVASDMAALAASAPKRITYARVLAEIKADANVGETSCKLSHIEHAFLKCRPSMTAEEVVSLLSKDGFSVRTETEFPSEKRYTVISWEGVTE